jgi:hypothetical protein
MVTSISSNFPPPDTKSRENKQTSLRSVEIKRGRANDDIALSTQNETDTAASEGIPESFINLSISSANMEAAKMNFDSEEAANRILLATTELIKQNPQMAEDAQANLPSQIVLSLFK